jgi:hypothetical protein
MISQQKLTFSIQKLQSLLQKSDPSENVTLFIDDPLENKMINKML